jgi:precorrin-3B synthase
MSAGVIKGWCPDAWRPMAAGDGLLVRIRPPLGRLTRAQTLALCDAAMAWGNGEIDVTSRANLQIRGVAEAGWRELVGALLAVGLIDPDPEREARGAILVEPDWRDGDDTQHIATALRERLADLPVLPSKVGFAIDAGAAPVLTRAPADFRVERAVDGRLLVRGDGRAAGVDVTRDTAVDALIALARWFVESGGAAAGRMARHAAAVRIAAADLRDRIAADPVTAIRVTPWRMLILEGGVADGACDRSAVRAGVDACVGAPACPQASVATRDLARRLAPLVVGSVHVSGCAKGCARARPADLMLTGRDGRFDLALHARAGAPPLLGALEPAQIIAHFSQPSGAA